VRGPAGCARCGMGPTNTAIVGFSAAYAYLDLCDEHLVDLLRTAHPVDEHDGKASLPLLGSEDTKAATSGDSIGSRARDA